MHSQRRRKGLVDSALREMAPVVWRSARIVTIRPKLDIRWAQSHAPDVILLFWLAASILTQKIGLQPFQGRTDYLSEQAVSKAQARGQCSRSRHRSGAWNQDVARSGLLWTMRDVFGLASPCAH